jgi:hypothetical protein
MPMSSRVVLDPAHAPKFVWQPGDLVLERTRKAKYDDSEPRDDQGRWTAGGGGGPDPNAMHAALYGEHAGTPADPVPCAGDIERAAKIIADGGNVTLAQPQEIATLLDRMQSMVQEAQAAGKDAPVFDLCNASVEGTNLFCQDHVTDDQGNPLDRVQMPQLATKDPAPGSVADGLPRNQFGEVDMSTQFAEFLSETGRPPEETTIDAKLLRASQDELNGAKVAGIADAIASGAFDPTTGRIWVTSDNYVIDGHHRWAATVADEYATGTTINIPVRRLDMDIGTALTTATYWTQEMGIGGASLTAKAYRLMVEAAALGISMKFDDSEPRDDAGRWTSGGGGVSTTSTAGYTDEGEKGSQALRPLYNDLVDKFGDESEAAISAKVDNVNRIGAALADRAANDPELATALGQAAGAALNTDGTGFTVGDDGKITGEGTTYQESYLHLTAGMTLEEVGAHQVATQLQDTWMSSASDSNPVSWGLQFAVGDRLGIDTSAAESYLAGHPEITGTNYASLLGMYPPSGGWSSSVEQARAVADSPATKAYVDQVYNDTQALLKSQGVTEVSMYRGVGDSGGQFSGQEGTNMRVNLNPVSSFSLTSETARTFAQSSSDAFGEHGYILETTVPADRIFSTSFTGPGCLGETEMIVSGGPTDVRVSVA